MEINIHTDMTLLDFTGYYLALIIQTAFFYSGILSLALHV